MLHDKPKLLAATALALLVAALNACAADRPSRAPVKGCAWEKLANAALGLAAWVQRCDFGFRKVDFVIKGQSLAVRFSDGGAPDPVVDVIEVDPKESPQAAIKRHFAEHTDPALARRCVLASYRGVAPRPGVLHYTFSPRPSYRKELRKKADPNEVGDPPCGDWGETPDGIQYYEVPVAKSARRILFVRVGQDEPLFDEKTLRVIAPARTATAH
jgi:hypothetical protein